MTVDFQKRCACPLFSFGASSVISAVLGFFVDGAITDLSFVVLVAPANFGSVPALFLRWSANAGKFRVR